MFLPRIYLLFPLPFPTFLSIEFTSLTRDTNRFVCESTVSSPLLSDVPFKPFLRFLHLEKPGTPCDVSRMQTFIFVDSLENAAQNDGPSLLGNIVYIALHLHSTRVFLSYRAGRGSRSRARKGSRESRINVSREGKANAAVMENYFKPSKRSNIETREEEEEEEEGTFIIHVDYIYIRLEIGNRYSLEKRIAYFPTKLYQFL